MVFKVSKILVVIYLCFFSASCTKQSGSNTPRELRLYTWSEYFSDEVLREFEKENNAKVKVDYVSTNEQLLTKLQISMQSKEQGYDLILPTDYMIQTMADLKLLKPIDHSKLSFLKDFENEFRDIVHYPNLKYAIPMAIGTTGLVLNRKLLPNIRPEDISWKDVFESPLFKGKVALFNDPKEVLNAALLANGKKLVTANESDIKSAFAYLKKHKSNILLFMDESKPIIEAGECGLCSAYSGDALNMIRKNPDLQYFIPKEGTVIWADNFAIPSNAQNEDLAYAFINKALSAESAKVFTENINYRTANLKAKKLLPKAITENPVVFPPPAIYKKLYPLVQKKEFVLLIDREWTELKSR